MPIINQPRNFQYWPNAGAAANDFNLGAGVFGLTLSASVWGTAVLQKLLPDGATYVPVSSAIAVSGLTVLQLPAGQYRLVVAGTTTFVGELALIARGY